jgi:hypothetical protein
MIFGFEAISNDDKKHKLLETFVKESDKRFKGKDFFKNPFKNAGIKSLLSPETYVVYLEHGYINPSIAIGFLSIAANIFLSIWVSVPLFILFLFISFMFSKYGIYAGLVYGLRKKGYKGKINLLKQKELGKKVFESL